MKYMTFPASCSYAGVANMLAAYGVDTDDRSIALGMKLPYLFSRENGAYLAGPMLQSAAWFDLFLNHIGFALVETALPAAQVPAYLKPQHTAMLGLRVNTEQKHAVVYAGHEDDRLLFLNNKWQHTDEPEQLAFAEAELLSRLDETAVIATLRRIPPKPTDATALLAQSAAVLRENLAEICLVCAEPKTVAQLRARLDPLFRPLLLDGIAMLNLIGQDGLAERFTGLQHQLLTALRQDADRELRLGDTLNIPALTAATEEYIRLIQAATR